MTAIVCGLLTALMWTNSNLSSSRAVRYIPQYSVVAWVTLVGLVITLPFCLIDGVPATLDLAKTLGLAAVGLAVVAGLVLLYGAFRIGKVGIVGPIAATEGAVAAGISTALGESLAPVSIALLIVVVFGVALSTVAPDPQPVPHERPVRAALMASGAACCFGVGIYLTARFSADVPLAWVLMVPRLVGTLILLLPLLLAKRLRLTRQAAPFVVATGLSEVLGYLSLALGSRQSIATVSVLASQVATFTVIGGRVLFKDRLGRAQIVGIAIVITGVTGLAVAAAA